MQAEMVRAILDGRKTMTRRVVKNTSDIIQDWDKNDKSYGPFFEDEYGDKHKTIEACPYGQVGDRLWVRETFTLTQYDKPVYKADGRDADGDTWTSVLADPEGVLWKPSIHMPLWASRITLEITDIRVVRVQEISERDAMKEGVEPSLGNDFNTNPFIYSANFKRLWDSINEKRGYSWDDNPWVWVVEFKVVS